LEDRTTERLSVGQPECIGQRRRLPDPRITQAGARLYRPCTVSQLCKSGRLGERRLRRRRAAALKQNATEADERLRCRHKLGAPREVPDNLAQETFRRCVPAYPMKIGGPLRPFEMANNVGRPGYGRHSQ
jgi:hypothetical protein